MKSNHFDNVITNFYRKVTIAFNFIKVTAKLLNAIRLLKYKRPRRKVHTRISLTVMLIRAQISIILPQKLYGSKFKPLKTRMTEIKAKKGDSRPKSQENGS